MSFFGWEDLFCLFTFFGYRLGDSLLYDLKYEMYKSCFGEALEPKHYELKLNFLIYANLFIYLCFLGGCVFSIHKKAKYVYETHYTTNGKDTVCVYDIQKMPGECKYPEQWYIFAYDKYNMEYENTFDIDGNTLKKIGDIKVGDTIVINRNFYKGRPRYSKDCLSRNLSRQRRRNDFFEKTFDTKKPGYYDKYVNANLSRQRIIKEFTRQKQR